jgi:AraC family transcriptional regulator, exoenzyme S synthesis regulatory protein ExsA
MADQCFYNPNIFMYSGFQKQYAAEEFVQEHVLCHIIEGELRFTEAEKDTIATAGQTILFRRNLLVKCEKRAVGGRPYRIVYFVLERNFVQQYAIRHNIKRQTAVATHHPTVLFLEPSAPLQGLLESVKPYFDNDWPITATMKAHKLEETIMALQEQDPALNAWMFEEDVPGKIDLEDFMERNYKFNVPVTKFAELTGRSLSTFQRDFRRTFGINAASWLLKRRLDAAYEAIATKHQAPVDIYLDLGFEDIAHFSRSFKQAFGVNASELKKQTASA